MHTRSHWILYYAWEHKTHTEDVMSWCKIYVAGKRAETWHQELQLGMFTADLPQEKQRRMHIASLFKTKSAAGLPRCISPCGVGALVSTTCAHTCWMATHNPPLIALCIFLTVLILVSLRCHWLISRAQKSDSPILWMHKRSCTPMAWTFPVFLILKMPLIVCFYDSSAVDGSCYAALCFPVFLIGYLPFSSHLSRSTHLTFHE